jgi:hypothetical protein
LENNGRPRKSKSINWAAGGCGTKLFAGVAFHFEAPEPRMLSGLKFSRQLALNHIAQKTVKKVMKMNREKFAV